MRFFAPAHASQAFSAIVYIAHGSTDSKENLRPTEPPPIFRVPAVLGNPLRNEQRGLTLGGVDKEHHDLLLDDCSAVLAGHIL